MFSTHEYTCPTGIATRDPRFQRRLVVTDKAKRVYHDANTMVHSEMFPNQQPLPQYLASS